VTTPPPPPTTPLLTLERLAIWTQETPLANTVFAQEVIEAVSTLLRLYGDSYWELATLPARARDIGYFTARNYYLNPDLARQSSVGPLQDTIDNKALTGIDLLDAHKDEIAALANTAEDVAVSGLWSMSTTRGPVETSRLDRAQNIVIWDTRGGWPIEFLRGDGLEPNAFGQDDE
jgi:hypothetical protein